MLPEKAGGTVLVCGESPGDTPALAAVLAAGGWESLIAPTLERAKWLASVRNFRLIVVTGESRGWLARALGVIRPATPSPVLVLSGHADAQSRLLDLGADMVLSPLTEDGLLCAAVRALIRRAPARGPTLRYLEAAGLRLDLWARSVHVDGKPVELSPTEFDVLHYLMAQAPLVVRHYAIIKAVWSWKYADERNALRIQVNRLRRKLGDPADEPRFIRSQRGTGYSFVQPVSEFADDRSAGRGDEGTDVLLDGHLSRLRRELLAAGDRDRACAILVDLVVGEGLCDGAAVLSRWPRDDRLHLVAQAGMSREWQAAVAGGIPPVPGFLSTDTLRTQQTRACVDIGKSAHRYDNTARLMRLAGLPVVLGVPLVGQAGAWGQFGCGRRADSAFTPAHCLLLEAAGYLLGTLYPSATGLASAG
ncbi:response regulator transcription factor [Amycolatopsis sp.]|uniref:response regulator transcription factor n=1 Tax=Amycolatopsis sp. TaxID=37632 RepID=UPI002C636880|nr:response regulator transcription factor [Amycolatopsis sp.]HVV08148.1 response regulator transcription factor [Amycolatopsis sp.]